MLWPREGEIYPFSLICLFITFDISNRGCHGFGALLRWPIWLKKTTRLDATRILTYIYIYKYIYIYIYICISECGGEGVLNGKCFARGLKKLREAIAD